MTPEQEDALIEIALSQVPKDSSDPWADHVRLAIRAAYAQGREDAANVADDECDEFADYVWNRACRQCAAAIRRGDD